MRQQANANLLRGVIIVAIILFISARHAYAVGTAANTTVGSSATVNYQVGGVSQPQRSSGTTGQFVVDRRINLVVAEVGASYATVTPATLNHALKFSVTNLTNGPLDFRLVYTQDATGSVGPIGGAVDSFDTFGVEFYRDNGDGIFNSSDTLINFLDEVAADAVITVYVVSDIPINQVDTDFSLGKLTAISAVSGVVGTLGVDHVETNVGTVDDPATVDTVFGDLAGLATGDVAQDGRHSAHDGYDIVTANIAVVKRMKVISDPFNGTSFPRVIPGAIVEYCIQISNNGNAVAQVVTVNDTIPEGSSYIIGSLFSGGTVTGNECNVDGTSEDDNAVGIDDLLSSTENTGFFNATTKIVETKVHSLAVNTTTASRFQVIIN
jgi:uncharacterized repeat protein (TIGR01451 family)